MLTLHSVQPQYPGTYSFKLETDYNFCNEVKEGVSADSAIRRFGWSREIIRHTGITLAFVGLPAPTVSYYC